MPHAGKALRNRAEVDMLDGFTAEMLARVQFAFTVSFRIVFPAFSIELVSSSQPAAAFSMILPIVLLGAVLDLFHGLRRYQEVWPFLVCAFVLRPWIHRHRYQLLPAYRASVADHRRCGGTRSKPCFRAGRDVDPVADDPRLHGLRLLCLPQQGRT